MDERGNKAVVLEHDLLGLDGGIPRLPLTELEAQHKLTMEEALGAFGAKKVNA